MIKIALTGSIGMGKSTVARMFEAAGVPVFDADAVVRELQGPGGALVEKIGALFPGTVRCGTLDRDILAQIVLEPPFPSGETFTSSAINQARGSTENDCLAPSHRPTPFHKSATARTLLCPRWALANEHVGVDGRARRHTFQWMGRS